MDVSVGGSMTGFAGESASLVSGRVSVEASESLHVSTGASGSLGLQLGSVGVVTEDGVSVSSGAGVSVGGVGR